MRYLRKYNESISLKDFCEFYLASLMDVSGSSYLYTPSRKAYFSTPYEIVDTIIISRMINHAYCYELDCIDISFKIPSNDILDDLIPFLTMLDNNYSIENIIVGYYLLKNNRIVKSSMLMSTQKIYRKEFTINGLDNIGDDVYISEIYINIKNN